MHGFRKVFVGFLALCLLVVLLGMADATSINRNFSSPDKLEAWLTDSQIYNHIIPSALSRAQTNGSQDGTSSSVSLNDAGVEQAAFQAFSPAFLQQSVNTFLNGNYAWLKGQTKTPVFIVNLNGPKQTFATTIGQLVQTHLASLPVCTPAQLSQLQLPVDPLTVACRPMTLDPKTEGDQVAASITSGDFINKPVITASSFDQTENSGQAQPYYQKVAFLPKVYSAAQWSPVVLGVISLLLILAIIFIAVPRCKGVRRVGSTLIVAGILLLITKFASDIAVTKIEASKLFAQTFTGQLRTPYHVLLHQIETSLVQTDLYFGIAFLVIGVAIIVGLILTRGRGAKQPKAPIAPPAQPDPASATSNIKLAPRRQPTNTDVAGPSGGPQPQPRLRPSSAPLTPSPKPKPPRPPRLIQ